MALTQPQSFEPWLQRLEDAKLALSGIYSLPQLAAQLLPNQANDQQLLIVPTPAGLRQIFFDKRQLRLSRQTPLATGSAQEVAIATTIEQRLRAQLTDERDVVNVAGKTTLPELCQLIKFCRLLLTNDTGPMHLAYALGTPLVAVFGSTSPELTGPLGPHCAVVRADVECAPCFLRECPIDFRCMNSISTDQVVEAALKLVGASASTVR
jgi:hypothetical protein